MEKKFARLKITCNVAKSTLFLQPGQLSIRTETPCGKLVNIQRINNKAS